MRNWRRKRRTAKRTPHGQEYNPEINSETLFSQHLPHHFDKLPRKRPDTIGAQIFVETQRLKGECKEMKRVKLGGRVQEGTKGARDKEKKQKEW